MLSSSVWAQLDPLTMVGGPTAGSGVSEDVATGSLGAAVVNPQAKPWSPEHPLFWFGAIAAVTFGLIGAATHVRVGPFRADLDLDRKDRDDD